MIVIAILLAGLPLVFYAQVCYASLFIETFVAVLYSVLGIHTLLMEKRRRG